MSLLRDRMKERRAVLGITQEGLAEKTGINVRSIRTYEGKGGKFPTGETLLLLAEHLKCDVAYLLGEVNIPSIIGSKLAGIAGLTAVDGKNLMNILNHSGRKAFMYLLSEKGFSDTLLYFEGYARACAHPYEVVEEVKATKGEFVNPRDLYRFLVAETMTDLVRYYGEEEVRRIGNEEG